MNKKGQDKSIESNECQRKGKSVMPTHCSTNMQDNRVLRMCLSKQRSQGERANASESYLFFEFNVHNRHS